MLNLDTNSSKNLFTTAVVFFSKDIDPHCLVPPRRLKTVVPFARFQAFHLSGFRSTSIIYRIIVRIKSQIRKLIN